MPGSAGLAYYKWHQCFSSEILLHFHVNNICLAQKLTKLQHFKEITENLIEKSLKIQTIKSINVCWSFFETLNHVKEC